MEIILADTAGFCFGVDRAVKAVEKYMHNDEVYTYGPIIHNKQVVKKFEEAGVKILDDLEENYNGTVIIRSHGVGPEVYELLNSKNVEVVDSTCPYVKRIHKIVEREQKAGQEIVIVGNPNHPEVIGINGWCNNKGIVISTLEEASNLQISKDKDICIVSQTTFDLFKFNKIVEILKSLGYNLNIFSTICKSTYDRQHEAVELSSKVDKMVVIGGKHSSNTQKLYQLCKKQCEDTFYIETVEDLPLNQFKSTDKVGITAGASTPLAVIEEVINTFRRVF